MYLDASLKRGIGLNCPLCVMNILNTKCLSWQSFTSTMNMFTLIKSIWSSIKIISGTNNNDMGIIGNVVMNSQKANRLVELFKNVSSSENFLEGFEDVQESAMSDVNSDLNKPFTHDELQGATSKAQSSSPGAYNLCYEMFKNMPDTALGVLRELLNM